MTVTIKDIARAVGMEGIVRKAVSGHATDAMDVHYSTAHRPEVARGLGNVYDLAMGKKVAANG